MPIHLAIEERQEAIEQMKKGLIRVHQFNKVEMYQFTTGKQSPAAFEELVEKAEKLVQGLGLHYKVSKLAAGDCSAGAARTYDIETYLPAADTYYEVSSASNVNRLPRQEEGI